MSPAINSHGDKPPSSGSSSHSSHSSSSDRHQERRTDLIWRVNYTNTLRDIPFDGKCINYPFEPGRFAEYRPTSMDLTRKFDLLTELDLGVRIDLVTAAAGGYVSNGSVRLAPEDERLLEDEPTSSGMGDKGGIAAKKRRVPWLRRTQYLGTDFQRYGTQTEKTETRIGRRYLAEEIQDLQAYKDPESQAQAIQGTFEVAQRPVPAVHHSRPGVTPVEVMPVFPDFDMWQYPAAQVLFDSDPAPAMPPQFDTGGVDRLSQAMIRGLQDDAGEQFVAYFLPTESTIKKRKRDIDDNIEYNPNDEYDYEVVREYNWNVRAPPDRQSASGNITRGEIGFAFTFHDDRVVYNELDTRVRLSKRKKPTAANVRSRLVVRFRPFTDAELDAQQARMSMLENVAVQEFEENAGNERSDGNEAAEGGESSEREEAQNDNSSEHNSDESSESDNSD